MACNSFVRLFPILLLLTAGCSLSPAHRIQQLADDNHLRTSYLEITGFNYTVFRNFDEVPVDALPRLHIYLDGDGTPWIQHRYVAADPTSRNPIALKLMLLDTEPSLYLSRPCHQGQAESPPCNPRLWTSERYAPVIIKSMAAALAEILLLYPADEVTLIGYSGGGTLALLIANQLRSVDNLITVAGNLDTDAWTRHHGYLPLKGSVNPVHIDEWRSDLVQIHLTGQKDKNIPAELLAEFRSKNPNLEFRAYADFGHQCCWINRWPEIMRELACCLVNSHHSPNAR